MAYVLHTDIQLVLQEGDIAQVFLCGISVNKSLHRSSEVTSNSTVFVFLNLPRDVVFLIFLRY